MLHWWNYWYCLVYLHETRQSERIRLDNNIQHSYMVINLSVYFLFAHCFSIILGYSTLVEIPFYRKSWQKKKRIRAVSARWSLFDCISPITATNRPRKKKCHPLKSAICMWQICIISKFILLTVWSYINADNEKFQFNCRWRLSNLNH